MKLTIELPIRLEVSDYHDFEEISRCYRLLNPNIKVKEIYTDKSLYLGIAYTGKLTDPENQKMIKQIKDE